MKRRALFAATLIGALALAGCSSNDEEPTKESATSSATPSESSSDAKKSKNDSDKVDPDLVKVVDGIVAENIKRNPTAPEDIVKRLKPSQEYLDKNGIDNPVGSDVNTFSKFKDFSDETNAELFKIYSEDNELLEYFDLEGLEPGEKTAIALWTFGMPLIFEVGEAVVPTEAFVDDGETAIVDLSKGTVTSRAGSGSLIVGDAELGKLPLIKTDDGWKVNSAEYYKTLETSSEKD